MAVKTATKILLDADRVGISGRERAVLRRAKSPNALPFYLELRRSLRREYSSGAPFILPATELAANEFLPGRRDRKLYLRLREELIRLGLLIGVRNAGFDGRGRRTAALFSFAHVNSCASNIVSLEAHRRTRR